MERAGWISSRRAGLSSRREDIRSGKGESVEMEKGSGRSMVDPVRVRRTLLVIGAVLLFVAGLLLLFAAARAQDQSGPGAHHFPEDADGWIMGSQSHEPVSLAGG